MAHSCTIPGADHRTIPLLLSHCSGERMNYFIFFHGAACFLVSAWSVPWVWVFGWDGATSPISPFSIPPSPRCWVGNTRQVAYAFLPTNGVTIWAESNRKYLLLFTPHRGWENDNLTIHKHYTILCSTVCFIWILSFSLTHIHFTVMCYFLPFPFYTFICYP